MNSHYSIIKHSITYLLFCLIHLNTLFAQQTIEFTHVTEGKYKKFVSSITQDQEGFIWFATNNGLNRFDGTNFKVYTNKRNDRLSLPHNYVENLLFDTKGRLWVSTIGGVSIYQKETDNFKKVNACNVPQINNDLINDIFEDNQNRIWWAGSNGIYLLNNKLDDILFSFGHNDTWMRIYQDHKNRIWALGSERIFIIDPIRLSVQEVQLPQKFEPFDFKEIIQDAKNDFWIGSWNQGIFKVDESDLNNIRLIKFNDNRFPSSKIIDLMIDFQNQLWIGSENYGIYKYDFKTDKIEHYKYNQYHSSSISSNVVWSLFEDNEHRIWVGLYDKGVELIDRNRTNFHSVEHDVFDKNSLSGNAVNTFLEDENNGIWIGTDGFGLNYWNRNTNSFDHYLITSSKNNVQKGYSILTTRKGSNNKIWIGTWGKGLLEFDPITKQHKSYTISKGKNSIASNMVFDIEENPKIQSEYWLTVWRNGISRFDYTTGKFYKYSTSKEESFKGSTVNGKLYYDILFDHNGFMWLAGDKGVEKVKIREDHTLEVEHFFNTDSTYVLSDNMASSIFLDSKNNIWVCTNNGLDLYNEATNSFLHFNKQNGLESSLINSIQEDNQGHYWVSTELGVSKFIFNGSPLKQNVIIQNYTPMNGLQPGAFNRKSGYKNSNGELFFGGVDGFNVFTPDSIKSLIKTPNIYLNDFKLFNQSVMPNDETEILELPIQNTEHITLTHTQSVFTIEYTGIYFTQPKENKYAFKLEGLEKDWNYVGNQRFATYTSLKAGEYNFLVKSANKDGIWNSQPISLRITILPPWYNTLLFRALLFILIISLIVISYRFRVGILKQQKERLQQLVKIRTQEIVIKNQHLEEAYNEVKVQNNNINDSLNYAKNIQQAMLVSEMYIKRIFPDSFIFFRPQNVVSGDFYWFKKLSDDEIAVATCDCTGHGVPGALISMLGVNILNQIAVTGETSPNIIMDKLNTRINISLSQEERQGRDGMDASLIVINRKTRSIRFAGAKNPLVLIRNGKIEKYKGDRMSIGGNLESDHYKNQSFTLHEITYDETDDIKCYMFSDGFQDQFGGENNKKFMVKNFYKVLEQISSVTSFDKQQHILEDCFDTWKGQEKQIDDVMVVGLKINEPKV